MGTEKQCNASVSVVEVMTENRQLGDIRSIQGAQTDPRGGAAPSNRRLGYLFGDGRRFGNELFPRRGPDLINRQQLPRLIID